MLRDKFRSSLRPLVDAISLAQFLFQIIPLLFFLNLKRNWSLAYPGFFFSSG
jgi:hypothetical protein